MIIGTVIGTVVATRKHEQLTGSKFLVVRPLHGQEENTLVAVDTVGAGIGDTVLVTVGSAASRAVLTKDNPVDAAIVGIVDQVNIV